MKIIATLFKSEFRDTQKGQVLDITLDSGQDVFKTTMFAGDVTNGFAKTFIDHQGKDVVVDVQADLYNGKLQYRLGYNAIAIPVDKYFIQKPAAVGSTPPVTQRAAS